MWNFWNLSLKSDLDKNQFNLPNDTLVLKHRGPDDYGYHIDDRIYLGHRRLSIIDLQTGNQPVYNENRSICAVFNGEIYNYQDITNKLIGLGHKFNTKSDTETIVHAYEEWGEKCLDRFRGMFSFAIWDKTLRTLFIS